MTTLKRVHTGRSACFCVMTRVQGLGEKGCLTKALYVEVIFAEREQSGMKKPTLPSWSLQKVLAAYLKILSHPVRGSCAGGSGPGLPQARQLGLFAPSAPPGRSRCLASGCLPFLLASFLMIDDLCSQFQICSRFFSGGLDRRKECLLLLLLFSTGR